MGWPGDGGTAESDSLHQGSTCPDQRGAQRREAMQEQRRHFPRRSQVMISLGSVDEGGEHADGANAILQFGYSAGSKASRAGLALHDLADRRGGLVRMDHWRPASTRCWHSPRLACCSRSLAHPHQTAHTATERPRGGQASAQIPAQLGGHRTPTLQPSLCTASMPDLAKNRSQTSRPEVCRSQ